MRTLAILLIACALAVGCKEADNEKSDFGAAKVAKLIVAAQAKCASVGVPNLLECADLPRPNSARLAAETADFAYELFGVACYDVIGRAQCDGLMELAYAQASAAPQETTVSAQAPAPARPAAP